MLCLLTLLFPERLLFLMWDFDLSQTLFILLGLNMPYDYWVSPISNRLFQKAGDTLEKNLGFGRGNKFSISVLRVLISTSYQLDGVSEFGKIVMYTFEIYKMFPLFYLFE